MTARIHAGAVAVAVSVALCGLLSGAGPALASSSHPTLAQIEREVMCPVCGVPLNVAESPQADRERAFIRDLIAHGRSEAQIRRALVEEFGPGVLALPPQHGFSLSAYLVPVGVLIALLAGAAVALRRWRRRGPTGAASWARDPALGDPAARDPAAVDPAEARRLDEQLANFR